MQPNLIYYHLYICNAHWVLWLDEFMRYLIDSKLLDSSRLHICAQIKGKIYTADKIEAIISDRYGEYIHNISVSTDNSKYEGITLKKLYDTTCELTSNSRVLYAHSKGASRLITSMDTFPEIGRHDWRNMMQWYCISRYEKCFDLLSECDAVGCRLANQPVKHFSGNFWWANSDYIKTLQDPSCDYRFCKKWKRLSCEFWVGNNTYTKSGSVISGESRLKSVHQPSVKRMNKGYSNYK